MSASSSTETLMKRWVEALANLTVAGSEPVSAERVTAMVSMLAKDEFPHAAFTSDSLHHCVQGHRFFPAYDDVRKALHGWWDANRPAVAPLLAGPGTADLSAEDRQWLAHWHKRRGEIFADGYQPKRGSPDTDLANLASLIRAVSPDAWALVSGTAAPVQRAPTDAEVAYVANLLRPEHDQRGARIEQEREAPLPFRDVTAKGDELKRIRMGGR